LRLAAHYFELSANQGNPDGQKKYASCLEHGNGVPEDKNKAGKYYDLAGESYEKGIVVRKDMKEAVR
jgi:TPR repeat protein